MRIINLKCEYQINPLGIDIINPRLGWILEQNNLKDRGQKPPLAICNRRPEIVPEKKEYWMLLLLSGSNITRNAITR